MPTTKTRTLLITGASSGIGRATARKMLQAGHRVIGVSRDCSQFRSLENFTSIELDFSNPEVVADKLASLKKVLSAVDGAIFCAGYGQFGSLEEFSFAQIQALIAVNFTSQVFLTRALIPILKKNAGGDVIFIGSEAALKGSRKGTIYCASKFAMRGFTQALREECARNKVRVTLINPGMVKTAFFDQLDFEPGDDANHSITAQDVAIVIDNIINASKSIVFDEINLSPLSKVIHFKKTH